MGYDGAMLAIIVGRIKVETGVINKILWGEDRVVVGHASQAL